MAKRRKQHGKKKTHKLKGQRPLSVLRHFYARKVKDAESLARLIKKRAGRK